MTADKKPHILVVEPNDITRKLIVGILTARGYGTYEALDGDAAVMEAKPLDMSCLLACWTGEAQGAPPVCLEEAIRSDQDLPPHLPVFTLKLPQERGLRQSAIRSLEPSR